jgi:hypothetical protein
VSVRGSATEEVLPARGPRTFAADTASTVSGSGRGYELRGQRWRVRGDLICDEARFCAARERRMRLLERRKCYQRVDREPLQPTRHRLSAAAASGRGAVAALLLRAQRLPAPWILVFFSTATQIIDQDRPR